MNINVPDIVNGCFELLGGFFLMQNVRRLRKEKQVKGVSVLATAFFMGWGYWNLYFYPAVNAWLSFAGGIHIVFWNTVWVAMALYYGAKSRRVSILP